MDALERRHLVDSWKMVIRFFSQKRVQLRALMVFYEDIASTHRIYAPVIRNILSSTSLSMIKVIQCFFTLTDFGEVTVDSGKVTKLHADSCNVVPYEGPVHVISIRPFRKLR